MTLDTLIYSKPGGIWPRG